MKLKKYLDDHRKEMDVEVPPTDLWGKIEERLDDEKKRMTEVQGVVSMDTAVPASNAQGSRSFMRYWKVAAVLFMTFFLGYWLAQFNMPTNNTQTAGLTVEQIDLSKLSPEAAEAENFYLSNISTFTNDLKSYQKEHPELVKEFLEEHEAMDEVYAELKESLLKDADNGQVLNLMIQNLQMRIAVLQNQKSILDKIMGTSTKKAKKTYL